MAIVLMFVLILTTISDASGEAWMVSTLCGDGVRGFVDGALASSRFGKSQCGGKLSECASMLGRVCEMRLR